ncbi:hypothetical protein B9G69_003750 [Bdellovibrio sp. SKB1291214]|uniref:hypothetical protein n=1 Tax=Bdellovibrio sp. SKB1291214 TaxID=1732569 RepID=UPI001132299B|nr:hypothetical protein [Bdellovibrio sp. SKB1291214]UYL09687.1 hypothetical protein B9G69_003750 [Bdellovibrio sp. SKB1291214]
MNTLALLLITPLFPVANQASVSSPVYVRDDHDRVGVCCSGNTQCAWPANFPNGSYCYCSYNGQISPGTVCGR